MSRALAALTMTIVLCGLWAFSTGGYQGTTRPMLPIKAVPFIGWLLLIVATGCMVTFHRLRIMALVLVGIIGLIVSCSFLYLSAPDLALTQISVEVVTVILLLLALNFLPKYTVLDSRDRKRGMDAFVATVAGQHYLDLFCRQLAHAQHGHKRSITVGLVEVAQHIRPTRQHVQFGNFRRMVTTKTLGGLQSKGRLVVARVFKADAEGLDRLIDMARHHADDSARINPAR